MYAKIQISGVVEVVTGMHIGGSTAFAAIGAVDSPIIKDVTTNLPIIPGSSMKGKMRTLLAKEFNDVMAAKPDDDCDRITRLFGSAKLKNVKRSRLIFSDMPMINEDELRKRGVQSITEVKFENTISRTTAVANPRQIERAIRGSKFGLDLMYEVENEDELVEDFETLAEGMKLIQYDYIGGSGSRGYGKVEFKDVEVDAVIGNISDDVMDKCRLIIAEALKK